MIAKRLLIAFVLLFAGGMTAHASEQKVQEMLHKATYVGTETCVTCHEKQGREFKLSTHARIGTKDAMAGVAQGCEMCHGPGSIHAEASGGKDNIAGLSPQRVRDYFPRRLDRVPARLAFLMKARGIAKFA